MEKFKITSLILNLNIFFLNMLYNYVQIFKIILSKFADGKI